MTTAAPSMSLVAALDPAVQANLYGFYDELRDRHPVYWDEGVRAWVVTSHSLAVQCCTDQTLSSVRFPDLTKLPELLKPFATVFSEQMLYKDAPDHTRIRSLLTRLFTPKAIESLRPKIERSVDELIAAFAGAGKVDVIGQFAYPLPMGVVCDLLDVPKSERPQMKKWSAPIAAVMSNAKSTDETTSAAVSAVEAMAAWFNDFVDCHGDDAESEVIRAFVDAERAGNISRSELTANLVLMMIAGHETTTNLIGNGLLALINHPEQLADLSQRGILDRQSFDELLRYDSPVQILLRRATGPMVLGDAEISAGETMLIVVGAANRDPAAWTDAHRLDLARTGVKHLGFGHGAHACLGAALARLEAEIAFPRLLSALPSVELDAGRSMTWKPSISFRELERLDVTFSD